MIMLRSSHDAIVSQIIEQHERHISDLRDQIADLKRLVFIPKAEPVREALEADAIISASEKPIEMSEEERTKILEGERELDMLVSGNYDEGLLN